MAWYGDLIKLVRDNPQADEDELKALWRQLCDAEQSASDRSKREEQVRLTTYNMVRDFVSLTNGVACTPRIKELPAWLTVPEYEHEFHKYFRRGIGELKDAVQYFQPAVEAMTEMIARLPDETARQRYYKAEASSDG